MTKPSIKRCAIYTRKSSEEGLEQDFNSLHAQREACEAYIKSQIGEGWKLYPAQFNDGGISGGTMERPGLKQLLADIAQGLIDVVVVYKVDRLTRSLADFAKMVEIFDAKNVSFVAVTQQFNTTTSMGRLTLNVLLSFAQFEREVTGERIRDKIAASKKKGMWMGGLAPLGYDPVDRKLIPNPGEAKTVNHIYNRYLVLGSARLVKQELDQSGIHSKSRIANGRRYGASSFSRGALYKILANPIYIGEVAHHGVRYAGQHESIVDRAVWSKAQTLMESHRGRGAVRGRTKSLKPLAGKLFDESGRCLTPLATGSRSGRRHHYYGSPVPKGLKPDLQKDWRLPALEIERTISNATQAMLKDQSLLTAATQAFQGNIRDIPIILNAAEAVRLRLTSDQTGRTTLAETVERVDLTAGGFKLTLALTASGTLIPVSQSFPMTMKRRGVEMRITIGSTAEEFNRVDPTLVKAISRAHQWAEELISGQSASMADIARRLRLDRRQARRDLYLAFLSPKIVEAILDGKQPPDLTLTKLSREMEIDPNWERQHRALGFV